MANEAKVALVTGASRGVGKGISIELGRLGFTVVVTARSVAERAVNNWPGTIGQTAGEVEAAGGRAVPMRLDLRDMDNVRQVFDDTISQLGRLDVMVNNARYADSGYVTKLVDTDWSDLEAMIDTNFRAVLLFHHLCVPVMIEQGGGVIINLTSGAAQHDTAGMPGKGSTGIGYPVTKAASHRIAPALAKEVADHNIAVLNLDPGHTLTERHTDTQGGNVSNVNIDRSDTHGVWIPAKAAAYIATCANPIAFTGKSIVARPFVEEMGLATPEELATPWKA